MYADRWRNQFHPTAKPTRSELVMDDRRTKDANRFSRRSSECIPLSVRLEVCL